jgi:acetyltransferase-like isoleucine patch superfamily enzyme
MEANILFMPRPLSSIAAALRPLIKGKLRTFVSSLIRPRVACTAKLYQRANISLGPNTFIDHYCILRPAGGKIVIDDRSYLGPFSVILASGGVTIGKEVIIGPHTVLASGNHNYKQTALPMQHFDMISSGPIVIEDDVWIGAQCLVCDNVTIATGCVIGGGSVVTRSTEPFGIYAGVPAKKIGSRKAAD